MTSILIGNVYTEELAGDPTKLSTHQKLVACALSQRMLWFARDGDIVVLPEQPSTAFLAYVATLADFDPRTVSIVIPDSGTAGDYILTGERLTNATFLNDLRRQVADRDISRILPFFADTATAALTQELGNADALPGIGFFSQGGAALANSKALFRCVAAGIGIPIAAGTTVQTRDRAYRAIRALIDSGHSVIVKQDMQASSEGNLILTPKPDIRAHGALSATVIESSGDVDEFLDEHWQWLSDAGASPVVVERFIEHARSVYAEYLVSDHSITSVGDGELLMAPILSGVVVPATCLSAAERTKVHEAARQLCDAYQAIGYRGIMSVDAVVSPHGEVFVHETNSRISGATHLHQVFTARITGPDRVLLDREHWAVPSMDAALWTLTNSGLSFDFDTRCGVIITADSTWIDGTLRYVVVGVDLDDAYRIELQLQGLFPNRRMEDEPVAAAY